jgi:hypothetical protein
MRKIRHNLIPANAVNPHEPESLKLHHLIRLLLNPALSDVCIFTIRRNPVDDARPPAKAIRNISTRSDATAKCRFLEARFWHGFWREDAADCHPYN